MKKVFFAFALFAAKFSMYSIVLGTLFSTPVFGQGHIIGTFPEMDGGLESQSFTTAAVTSTVLGAKTEYTVNHANAIFTLVNNAANARTGTKYATLATSGNSTYGVFSPTTATTVVDGDSYVIQFFYKAGGSTSRTFNTALSPDGSDNLGSSATSSTMNQTTWTKSSVLVTAGSGGQGENGLFFFRYNSTTSSPNSFDDMVMYAGTAIDNTAPGNPTAASAISASSTSLLVSWAAPGGGVDGGGYVVVRAAADPTTTPNQNGIYANGNTVGSGTVVYIGASTSFEDTGLDPNTTYYYRVYAVDKAFNYSSAATCNGRATPPGYSVVTTAAVGSIASTTAASGGNISADGGNAVTGRGVVWGTSPYPTVPSASSTSNGTGTGAFTSSIVGLSQAVSYYVRAYSINSAGTSYGQQIRFTTVSVPVVSTTAITNISGATASGGGNVTADGGATVTARGVCWSTATNPTITNNILADGSGGLGSFTSNVTGLTGATTYYLRAYATNSQGTGYGAEVSFTTLSAYYNKPGADISDPASWGDQPNGQGGVPANFSNAGVVYHLFNTGAVLNAPLVITGAGSKILLGDGLNAVNFTIPAAYAVTGTIDISASGTLNIQNTTNPSFGVLATGSTVNYDGAGSLTVPVANFYNLGSTNDGGATRTLANGGTIGVAGAFMPGSGTFTTTGNTITFNGNLPQTIPSFTFNNLITANAAGCTTNGDPNVGGTLTVNESLTIAAADSFTLLAGANTTIAASKALLVNGIFSNKSTVTTNNTFTGMTVANNGWYKVSANGGKLPQTIIFSQGSTLHINNVSPNNSKTLASRLPDKNFNGHVIWNCSCLPSENPYTEGDAHHLLDDDPDEFSTMGDFTLVHGNVRIGSGTDDRRMLVNNMNILGGDFRMMDNTSEGDADMVLTVNGNLTVNTAGGGLNMNSRGAGASDYPGGTGIDTLYLRGNLIHTNGYIKTTFDAETVGAMVFDGTSGQQTAVTPGFSDSVNVIIKNPDGVDLQSGVLNPHVLKFVEGRITAEAGTMVYPYSPIIGASNSRYVVTLGSGALKYRTVANADTTFYVGISATSYNPVVLKNEGTPDQFKVSTTPTPAYIADPWQPDSVVNVQYMIDEDVAGGSDVTMALQWNVPGGVNNEATQFDRAGALVIGHYTGGIWVESPSAGAGAGTYANAYKTSAGGFTSFSPFMVGNTCALYNCLILPVKLLSFTGAENNGDVDLLWTTSNETNLKNFEIERSLDSRNFGKIATTTAKNTSGKHHYYVKDEQAPGGWLYYRLKIFEKDGKYRYSNVVAIHIKKDRLLQMTPNPVAGKLTITHSKANSGCSILIYGVNGSKMALINPAAGAETTVINTSNYAAGVYLLRFENNGTSTTEKFVKLP